MFYKLHYESLLQISGFVIIKKFQWNASIQYMPYSIHTKTQNFFSISHLFHFLLSYFLRFIQINIVSQIFFSSADEKKNRCTYMYHKYSFIDTKPYLYYHCSTEGKMFFFFEKKIIIYKYLSTDHNEVILQFNQLFSIEAIRFFLIEIVFWKIIQCWKKNIYFHHHQSLIHEFCSINAAKFSQEGENYNRAIYQLKSISERYLLMYNIFAIKKIEK